MARILIPGVLFWGITSCKNDMNEVRALTSDSGCQLDKAEGVTVVNSKDGKIKMRAFAREFVRNNSAHPPYIDLNGRLKAEFYNDSGAVETVLTADSSRYYEVEGNVLVWDSVVIVSTKGETLVTDELIWNAGAQKFFTEKPVTITTATEVIHGLGMEANSDFTWYRILHPRGTVQVEKGEVPK